MNEPKTKAEETLITLAIKHAQWLPLPMLKAANAVKAEREAAKKGQP